MKALRTTVFLVALLVLPLFATQTLAADFFVPLYDVPNDLVGANTDDQPVIGFILELLSGETLDKVKVRSYIQRVYATERIKLWREDGTTPGFQAGEDEWLKTYVTSSIEFDINDEISFLGIGKVLPTDDEVFYITLDINTAAVNADPDFYDGTGLEVTLNEGYIVLEGGDANSNHVHNPGWNTVPPIPPHFNEFTLVFDTKGPDFDLHFCIEDNTCSTHTYYGSGWTWLPNVDQEDSLRICALNVEGDIDTSVGIHVIGWVHLLGHVSSKHMFGVDDITLMCPNDDPYGCWGGEGWDCDSCWSTGFRIPDKRNTGGFYGVDADSGHWAICAWAQDTVGNIDTVCIEHDQLAYRIDTKKPIIDEITWELVHDWNGDGKIGLGDCIMIIGKGYSNPIDPLKECVQMRVDTSWMAGNSPSYPGGEWAELSDTLQENNRIFRRVFCLTNPLPIDSSGGCPVNFLVEAWDNACNYDTSRGEICADMDLDPPHVDVLYEWHTDYDTMWACLGLGDKALIEATVGGFDIFSVTAMMDSAGIDELMRHALPLTHRGGGVYDTIWTITEPPIIYGKDKDNTQPPPVDNDYSMTIIACDDVGNCDTASGTLNKTLDTRRPRPIGFAQFCPDSVPCALTAQSLAGGIIELMWDTACDENDAFYYYVWANDGSGWDSIGATSVAEQSPTSQYYTWHSEPLAEGYWTFKIKTEDNCSNMGDFSCVVGAYADATPPHVCIAVPDSGLTFGSWFPVKAVADSESHDVESACLWYRLRPDLNDPPLGGAGAWTKCWSFPWMSRPGDGYVFTDSVHCLEGVGYIGWVEMIVMACDEVGNCQDTSMAYDDACLVDDDVFRPGHFLFYWDTLAPAVHLVSVNGFPSPQSDCGFDVDPSIMNEVVIDVDGATAADSFEVEVRGPCSGFECRIFHQDFVTMPCTIWVSVEGWDEGKRNLYINVKDYDNDRDADLQVELCVPPPPPGHCVYISQPVEWQRIPCTGTSGYNCVEITARMYEYAHCEGVLFTEARFQWSPTGLDPWYTIEDVIGSGAPCCVSWSTCWDNTDLVEDGDTVYFRVIAHDEFYMADTSYMVKVFVDCTQPNVKLRIEELYYTCGNEIPKVPCDPLILKAVLEDTLIDIDRIRFFVKRHSVPDIHEYWIPIDGWAQPAWSDNIWKYDWDEPCCGEPNGDGFGAGGGTCMEPNDYWDIRVAARDIAGHYMFDYDDDKFFDDSTFNTAVTFGAAMTVFVDDEAPQPAISRVADTDTLGNLQFEFVNPDDILGGSDKVYTKAFDSVTVEISVLPSEDTCEVMKVEYFACNQADICFHVGTSTDPYHYPVTFEPVSQGLIPYQKIENSWWQGYIKAVLYDSLGNSNETEVDWYVLDVTPSQAMIVNPENDSYVWGSVLLESKALNAYEINKVCYEYRAEGESDWYPVNEGYPNACAYHECGEDIGDYEFPIVWNTLNTIPDGAYYLRAVATDCSNNVDDDPPTIKVTVCNELPSVTISDPSICFRECPDDTVDTNGFVGGTVLLEATVGPALCPATRVVFMSKDIFNFPGAPWNTIGIDYWPTDGVYDTLWSTTSLTDGRYHVRARVYNAAGRYKDSDPIMVSVDNTDPLARIVSVNGETHPEHMDIGIYDTLAIQVVAYDTLSPAGASRCYNSGVTLLGFQVSDGAITGDPDTQWPLTELDWYTDFHDGDTLFYWNVSGLTPGDYWIAILVIDCIGNEQWDWFEVHVYDLEPPLVTVGAFFYNPCTDQHFVYGYTCCASEDDIPVWAKFEYRMIDGADTSAWLGTGEADWYSAFDGQSTKHCFYEDCACCYNDFLQFVWDPSASLVEGVDYQGRIFATDYWGNTSQDYPETHAPIVNFTYENGVIVPQSGPLGALSFEKNWSVGRMHGIVKQTSVGGLTPQVFGVYLPDWGCGDSEIECVWMQQNLNNPDYFGGSFEAGKIWGGGSGTFFSSVNATEYGELPQATGDEEQLYTYLKSGDIMAVKVDADLGTFTTYCLTPNEPPCVFVPGGALFFEDKHIVVWPEDLPPISWNQPTWIPVGDDDGFATYVGFTEDCEPWQDCCFKTGRYAKIKINYSSELDALASDLIVAWWDNRDGRWETDGLKWGSPYSEGFNTEDHYVEFVTDCLLGPFAVIQIQERECEGTIMVNMVDMYPYCNGYTNAWPTITASITDRIQGPSAVDENSIRFKLDLYESGELITIYDGDSWAEGFGNFSHSGYDDVSGLFKAGWDDDSQTADPLPAGPHMATVTGSNYNSHTCTDTLEFIVDNTPPNVRFAAAKGAYVGANPHFCIYFTDTEAGVDKNSIWIDIYGDETNSPDPNNHSFIGTLPPAQLNWVDDTTVCVDGTFEYHGGYLHVYVYGGPDCDCRGCSSPQYYGYECGMTDCVGNHTDVFWQYYTVDANGPSISFIGDDYCDAALQFRITDDLSGLLSVYVYEDSSLAEAIVQDEHNPDFWWYTPTAGVKHVDIEATDNIGNKTVKSFDLPSDCEGPKVVFDDGYLCKNPTLKFWVTDPAGVDWTTVNVRIYGCGEECLYWAEDLTDYIDTETGEVTIDGCHLDCSDGNEVEIYVFSGTSWTGNGPHDLNGNYGKYRRCSFVVDYKVPSISVGDKKERPIEIKISDARSGVDWSTLEFYEDGLLICAGLDCMDPSVNLDTTTGKLYYDPDDVGGFEVEIRVNDMTGCNLAVKSFEVKSWAELALAFGRPHNESNPFNPEEELTYIYPDLNKGAYVTIKIYDFAGEFVRNLTNGAKWIPAGGCEEWDGRTDGGTEVANGTYLCYVHARDDAGSIKTAVIKITVLKQDK